MATSIAPNSASALMARIAASAQSAPRFAPRPAQTPATSTTSFSSAMTNAAAKPAAQPQIAMQLRRAVALLSPNMRGSLKQSSVVKIISAEDSGIGYGVAVLYAADGSGVSVVRLPR